MYLKNVCMFSTDKSLINLIIGGDDFAMAFPEFP